MQHRLCLSVSDEDPSQVETGQTIEAHGPPEFQQNIPHNLCVGRVVTVNFVNILTVYIYLW